MAAEGARTPAENYVFDLATSRRGYRMNKLFGSLVDPANRDRFTADEAAYCAEYRLTPEQTEAVLDRDWQAMLDSGGSIFYVFKLAMMDKRSMQYLGGVFTGMTEEEFVAALKAGGRIRG
ncbi:MAG: protocatechuate 4,5-dioxygenase alpha subunit [Modestobacter sp.]|jgi:protocatechuate 4,5-dioxygenase alpha chain|nr:protocatechuate 4,5-dioxygenase alpha subunit [Modestobacter sp.]